MLDLDAIVAQRDKAIEMISALCKSKGAEGSREWLMSIPARPDHDPDLVIGAALNGVADLVAEVRRLREALTQYAKGYPGGIGETARETVTRYRFPVAPGITTEVVFVGGPPTRRAIATTIETLLLMERARMEPETDGPAPEAGDRRCENAGCGSGAWLTDEWECPECGWRPV